VKLAAPRRRDLQPSRFGRSSAALAVLLLASALGACSGGVRVEPGAGTPAAATGSAGTSARPIPTPGADSRCTAAQGGVGSAGSGARAAVDAGAPEVASGFRPKDPAYARSFMAVTANALASSAACTILANGGTAVDAAVAAQMVLNLVEPQSSGIGGGAFMMHFDAASREVAAYDGRETAPRAAGPDYLRHVDDSGAGLPVLPDARSSGRSVGTPGLVRMLETAHRRHGSMPWRELFQPAIALARHGFDISPRMAESIAAARLQLSRDPEAAAYFLNRDGTPKVAGTRVVNVELADTLAAIADDGASAFYSGAVAESIVQKIRNPPTSAAVPVVTPGRTTLQDLAEYRAVARPPVCVFYRSYEVCGMPPPSSGGIAVAQTLLMLEHFDLPRHAPANVDRNGGQPSAQGVHLLAEANRLAFADRNRYVADTDFVPLPGGSWDAMLDRRYLRRRAALIDADRTLGTAPAGALGAVGGTDASRGLPDTTHLSIVDRHGNAVSMTSTIEGGFGSYHMTRGFLLNNELTDFSAAPSDADGPIANRVQPLKRPRSSMAPTLVFHRNPDGTRGEFHLATGSPGGAAIIHYVAKTLVASLDWGLDAQQAVSLVNFGAFNGPTTHVEGAHPGVTDQTLAGLVSRGHSISRAAQTSGLSSIVRTRVGGEWLLVGGADPRRENVALGE
jgi:gamma-glutamyltranspeptidase / glutathione hydrolase